MSTAAGPLTAFEALARTKQRLFPDEGHVVADTQFSAANWLADTPTPEQVRAERSPFYYVRVGSGNHDFVGVAPLDNDLSAVDRPPLVVGNRTTTETTIRLQASAQGAADQYDLLCRP